MQQYVKDRFTSRKKDTDFDLPICELCGKKADDIHHLTPSSRGKRKHNPNGSDLIALCREHHNRIHANNNQDNRDILKRIVSDLIICP